MSANPTPATGQVWQYPSGAQFVLGAPCAGEPGWFRVNQGSMNVPAIAEIDGLRCVGVDNRPGSRQWVISTTARLCGIHESEVDVDRIESSPARCGTVDIIVPHDLKISHETAKHVTDTIQAAMPPNVVVLMVHDHPPELRDRKEREARRREIDAVLREDTRRFPAFATARRRAVVSIFETVDGKPTEATVIDAEAILAACHAYEGSRGGMAGPLPEAWAAAGSAQRRAGGQVGVRVAIGAYERARSLP